MTELELRFLRRSVIKIVYFGTPDFSASLLEKLIPVFDIQAVVTNPDAPVGRDQVMTASPVAEMAEKHQVSVLKPETFDQPLPEADLYLVFAYGKILPEELLNTPKLGSINVHTSLLPKYRGTAPVQAAILNGDTETGATLIKMDDKMDHGPILAQKSFKLSSKDTLESVTKTMAEIGAELVLETLPKYAEGKIRPQVQDESQATYTWKKAESKQQAYFDITNPPSMEQLDRMARAFYPWPNAWTTWNGKVVKFYPEKKIQMEGKKIISWKEFAQGYSEFPLQLQS